VPEITPHNWDGVGPRLAKEILAALPPTARGVVLSLATDPRDVLATADAVGGDFLHVVRTDVIGAAALAAIRASTGRPLMGTVAVTGAGSVDRARGLAAVCDVLLLDTRHASTGVVGASGQVHDWSLSARIVREVDVPVVLAGGLGPDNVTAAIERVAPWGVDSETRTSRADDRRTKDPVLVRRFVERARAACPADS
jgi:phosphoribosylanthranilate isomerase